MRLTKVVLFLAAALALFGQESRESYVLAGRVVNSVTGEPVKRALVVLLQVGLALRTGQPPSQQRALTDAAGLFRFAALPEGRYQIAASKPQFADSITVNGQLVALGPSKEDVTVRLAPLCVIEGTVRDQNGAPMQGVSVIAVQSRVDAGRRVRSEARNSATDDRGRYRLWNLDPGTYFVRAGGRSGGARRFVGGQAPTTEWNEAAATVYYGGAHVMAGASPLVLSSGQHLEADFNLSSETSYRLHGVVTRFAEGQSVSLALTDSAGERSANRASFNSATGAFVVHDILPGAYRLRATQVGAGGEIQTAEADVRITNANVFDVGLELEPAADVLVHTNCGNAGETRDNCFAMVSLIADDGRPYIARPMKGGLTIHGAPPGDYHLAVQSFGRYVARASIGSLDLTSDSLITIRRGATPDTIELSFAADGGSVDGTFAGDAPLTGVQVLLIANSRSVSGPQVTPLTPDGRFSFEKVAPGDYKLYALSDMNSFEYMDPEALHGLTAGADVSVRSGAREKVTLKGLAR